MILIDISPTSVQFLHNGKVYLIKEIVESNKELLITAGLVEPAENMELIQNE